MLNVAAILCESIENSNIFYFLSFLFYLKCPLDFKRKYTLVESEIQLAI